MSAPQQYRQLRFERPPGATELLLVRHGESEAAVDGRDFPMVDGHGDPDLSDEGREQASRVCARLSGESIDAIVVTSLRRTVATAAPLAQALNIAPVVERDLREVHLGEWEGGVFRKHVLEGHPLARRMSEEQRYDVIPGAEPAAAFARRVRHGVLRVAAAHTDRRVAVFTHGGVIAELLAQATGSEPFAFMGADNASISHIVVTPDRWHLRRFNDTTHLDPGLTVQPVPLT
ncbi:MAG TPA: histidine phosphatase family protein [Acidimicrobiales bacterium]|nr:histidine phosphatase family protein [Acidimicrobiales bacterium]